MRIRTQLFLGAACLAAALILTQSFLQWRQLEALEDDVTRMAEGVGAAVFSPEGRVQVQGLFLDKEGAALDVDLGGGALPLDFNDPEIQALLRETGITEAHITRLQEALGGTRSEPLTWSEEAEDIVRRPGEEGVIERHHREVRKVVIQSHREGGDASLQGAEASTSEIRVEITDLKGDAVPGGPRRTLKVIGPEGEASLPLPESQAAAITQSTLTQSLAISALLMLLGLIAAAIFADRVSQPLRSLAQGADSLAQGALGTQVPVEGSGEVAELQRAFNRMSTRLAELEEEKARWQARAHLAELGDVARGLGHTLRNPLNTLGLAVEELAEGSPEAQPLVATVRAQIARIDRWLRGFLALGAGRSASPEVANLGDILEEVALETMGRASLNLPAEDIPAQVVRPSLKAAILNLVINAIEASPERQTVEIDLDVQETQARIRISDRGPGLPEVVREHLFSPHITTRPEGSGMGIFLARQLIEGGHGGRLRLTDRPGGGTVAEVLIPLEGRP